MSVVKPVKPAATKSASKKPPAGKLTLRVCDECERDVLMAYTAGSPVRLEVGLTTAAVEPTMWALGQPTYAVRRTDDVVELVLRIPSPDAPPWPEIAIAHICETSRYWMARTLKCPQWFGHSRYIVAVVDRSYKVLRADEHGDTYREVSTCSSPEAAQDSAHIREWRDRARWLR